MLQQYTAEELQIEYLMYAIEQDPQEAFPRRDMSNVQFRTGDPIIDEWESKLAEGKDSEIDWDAGVDQAFLKRFKAFSRKVTQQYFPALKQTPQSTESTEVDLKDILEDLNGFSDVYK